MFILSIYSLRRKYLDKKLIPTFENLKKEQIKVEIFDSYVIPCLLTSWDHYRDVFI